MALQVTKTGIIGSCNDDDINKIVFEDKSICFYTGEQRVCLAFDDYVRAFTELKCEVLSIDANDGIIILDPLHVLALRTTLADQVLYWRFTNTDADEFSSAHFSGTIMLVSQLFPESSLDVHPDRLETSIMIDLDPIVLPYSFTWANLNSIQVEGKNYTSWASLSGIKWGDLKGKTPVIKDTYDISVTNYLDLVADGTWYLTPSAGDIGKDFYKGVFEINLTSGIGTKTNTLILKFTVLVSYPDTVTVSAVTAELDGRYVGIIPITPTVISSHVDNILTITLTADTIGVFIEVFHKMQELMIFASDGIEPIEDIKFLNKNTVAVGINYYTAK